MIYDGSLVFLYLKIKDKWYKVGGMKVTKFILNQRLIESNNMTSGIWRELLEGVGLKYVDLDAAGYFSNTRTENELRRLAFQGETAEYKMSFSNGEYLVGKFRITYYERVGQVKEEENYHIALASSGEVTYY